jgi:putative nucleotidyltransferase with HDIG domain
MSNAGQAKRLEGSVGVNALERPTSTTHTTNLTPASMMEHLRLFIVIIVSVLYVVVLGLMLYVSTGNANVGLTARPDATGRWIVTSVVPAGLSFDAGVRPGDIVVGGDVLPVIPPGGGAHAEFDFNGARMLEIIKADSLASAQPIHVSTETINGGSALVRWGFALLGLIFVGVGGPVYVKARQRTAASAFYVFCITTAIALALINATVLLHGWALGLMFATMLAWATSFAFFFFNFPVRIGRTAKSHSIIIWTLLGIGTLMLVAYLWVLAGHAGDYEWVRPMLYLYIAGCVAAGLARLTRSLVAEQSPEIKQQLVLLLGGTAFAVGPPLLLSLIPAILFEHALVPWELASLALGIMPLAFAYAITQNQLLGVRGFVRRSVVYLVMGFSMLLLFSVVAAFIGTAVPSGWVQSELGLIGFGVFVFIIAICFGYAQRRVERLVDRYIYHDAYDYKEALRSFSTQLAAEQNLQVLSDQLVERTCRLMNLTCGLLLLAEQPDDSTSPSRLDFGHLEAIGLETSPDMRTAALEQGRIYYDRERAHAHAQKGAAKNVYLVPYSKFGDYADWMLSSIESELSHIGINLHQPGTAAQLIYLHGNAYGPIDPETMLKTGPFATVDPVRKTGSPGNDDTTRLGHQTSNGKGPDLDVIRSFLGVPLWTRSRFVGVLCLGGKKTGERFTKDDLSLLTTLGSQAALAIFNAQLYEAREQALLDTITALAHAIEAKDTYTINHCEKITDRAVALAQAMALPRHEVENIRLGSILHDVGKIGIPDAILNKPGKLTEEEYEIIKQHAQIGARIVQSVGALQGVVPIIRHHQERYDGTGYPDRLAGEDIPIGARIIAAVDAYGAMTEDRVYRKALGHNEAVAELKRFAGRQFDPQVVITFIRLLKDQPELAEIDQQPALAGYGVSNIEAQQTQPH